MIVRYICIIHYIFINLFISAMRYTFFQILHLKRYHVLDSVFPSTSSIVHQILIFSCA